MSRRPVNPDKHTVLIKDNITGELCQMDNVTGLVVGRPSYRKDFFMNAGHEMAQCMAKAGISSAKAYQLVLSMYALAEIGTNRLRRTIEEMSEWISADTAYTCKLLKELREAGLLIKERNGVWFMNPAFGWKGTFEQGEKIRQDWDRAIDKTFAKLQLSSPESTTRE